MMAAQRIWSVGWVAGLALFSSAGLALLRHCHQAEVGKQDRPTQVLAAAGSSSQTTLPLGQPEREFLWQVEHHGLVLGKHGFSAVADALSRCDCPRLEYVLADDFMGEVLQSPRSVRLDWEFAQVLRQEDAGEPRLPLSRGQFTERLFEYRRSYAQPPQVQLSLISLAPVRRQDLEGPWQGSCQLRLWGEMETGQPGETVLRLRFRIAQPTEATLQQGGWLHSCALEQSQTGRAARPLLRDATTERGIDPRPFYDNRFERRKLINTGGVYLCDFDRDDCLDVLITDVNRLALFRGKPDGKFEEVSSNVGLDTSSARDRPPVLAAFVDLDGDNWEDLLLGTRAYRNAQGQRFVDVTHETNLRLPEDGIGVAAADFDCDGHVDLYAVRAGKGKASSWLDGGSGVAGGNQLWRNQGNWRFENVTDRTGTSGGHRSTFTAVWLDANNDGWPDLYVPSEFGVGVLLVNQTGGKFREHYLNRGPGDFGTMGVTCGDIDNDGNIDLYAANMYSKAGNRVIGNLLAGAYPDEILTQLRHLVAGSQLHRNLGDLRFEQLGKTYQIAAVGWAYGPSLVDLDNDGWLDLYATCGFISASRSDPDG